MPMPNRALRRVRVRVALRAIPIPRHGRARRAKRRAPHRAVGTAARLRAKYRHRARAQRRGAASRCASTAAIQVTTTPANKLTTTARPSRLQPISPKNASGANNDQPHGPSRSRRGSSRNASTKTGTNSNQTHSPTAAAMPNNTARGDVCGRHNAKPRAGASAANAENESAPTSAKALLPAINRP